MNSARMPRGPSPRTAALVRVAAFLVALACMVLVASVLAGAAMGHGSITRAFTIVAVASALTVVMTLAARGLDPLRR